jgi:hypothetical protein
VKNKKTKPRNKREATKYPALDPALNLRSRFELFDQDYIDQLTEKEKRWLNDFNEEFINANFKHKGKRIHNTETVMKTVKTTGKKRKVDLAKQEAEHSNNARNRCILTKAKASGAYIEKDSLEPSQLMNSDPESELVSKLDAANVVYDFEYGSDESNEN